MVLISTENLERMQQQQLQQQQHSTTAGTKENTAARNSENTESMDSSTVRTPGTPLSRLDAEMSRILNSAWPRNEDERWKLYREVLWRYLRFIREAQGGNNTTRTEDENEETRAANDDETTRDDIFRDLSRTSVMIPHSSSIVTGNNDTSRVDNRILRSIERILETVPKTYRAHARLLLRHLRDKAIPARISWDDHGTVTIDGNVVKDSNIADLINDATRERKTAKATGRVQFARLLRALNTPTALVRNKVLLSAISESSNIDKIKPTASSTPNISRVRRLRRRGGGGSEKRKNREQEEKADDCALFLTRHFRADAPITFMKNTGSLPARKRRLLEWNKLK